jgi:hypothetical protein
MPVNLRTILRCQLEQFVGILDGALDLLLVRLLRSLSACDVGDLEAGLLCAKHGLRGPSSSHGIIVAAVRVDTRVIGVNVPLGSAILAARPLEHVLEGIETSQAARCTECLPIEDGSRPRYIIGCCIRTLRPLSGVVCWHLCFGWLSNAVEGVVRLSGQFERC